MDIAQLGIRVDSRQVLTASRDMDGFTRSAKRMDTAAGRAVSSADRMAVGMGRAAKLIAGATAAAATLGATLRAAEQYTGMSNSLRAMGLSADQATTALASVAEVANRTRAPLDATASLYQRISIAGRDLNATQAQVLQFTENVGLAMAQQGGSAASASGAILQLSQAMSGGTVRAEEFNSILEGAFPIAQAAADAIDGAAGSVGRLRQMVIDGDVSSKEFFDAILSQTAELQAAFANTTPTIGQALTVLGNSFTMLSGRMDTTLGISSAIAKVILVVSENLGRLAAYASAAAVAFGGRYSVAMALAAARTVTLSGALVGLRIALVRTGIGALIVGAGELLFQFGRLVEATGGFGAAMSLLGEVARGVWQGIVATAAAVPDALQSAWLRMQSGFLRAVAEMAWGWSDFLQGIASASAKLGDIEVFGQKPFAGLASSLRSAASGADDLGAKLYGLGNDAASGAAKSMESFQTASSEGFAAANAALGKLQASVATTRSTIDAGTGSVNEYTDALNGGGGSGGSSGGGGGGGAAGALSEMEQAAEAARKQIDQLEFDADPVKKYHAEVAKLDELLKQGLSTNAYAHAVDKLRESLADSIPMVNDVASAFGDFVARGFQDFKGFVDSVKSSFTQMLSDMIATAARNQILISLGITGGGAAGIGGAGGGLAQAGSGILGQAGGILGKVGGIGSALVGGFTNSIGSLFSGGIGSMFGNIGAQVSAAATGSLTAIAGAVGAIAVPVLAVTAAVSFFKTKTRELDSGIRVTIGNMDTLVESFKKTEKSRFWGLSKSTSSSYDALEDEAAKGIVRAVSNVQDSVVTAAGSLGIAANTFDDYAIRFKISTKGLSDEDIAKAVEERMTQISDEMADMALAGTGLVRDGEGAGAALSRLSTSLLAVNAVMDTLAHTAMQASLTGAAAASELVDAFGGLDALSQATTAYYNAFYTDAERTATAVRQSTEALRELGAQMPVTRAEYRAMVEAQDLTAQGGRELYAALIGLSGVMDQVLPQISTFTAEMQQLATGALSLVDEMSSIATEAARAAGQAATQWERAITSLETFLTRLTNSTDSALSLTQRNAINSLALERTFAAARGGDINAVNAFGGAAGNFLDTALASSASAAEYRVIEGRIRAQGNMLAEVAKVGKSREELLEDLYTDQIDVLSDLKDYLQSDGVTQAGLADFSGQLGSLEASINQARLFDYDFVRENIRLDVIAQADLTPALEGLLTGIPDSMAFALNGPFRALTDALNALSLLSLKQDLATKEATFMGDQRAALAVVQRIRDLEAQTGATLRSGDNWDGSGANATLGVVNGKVMYEASHLFGPQEQFETWREQFWNDGGLEDQLAAAGSTLDNSRQQVRALRDQIAALGSVPQYGAGGLHSGGLRIVGERGPEMEATGPSRIHSNSDMQQMFRDPELAREMKALREETAKTREENRQLMMKLVEYSRSTDRTLRGFDVIGLPAERTA